jgi:hypothetical protein
VARPSVFHKIFSAPRSNTAPVRPLGVKIVKLGLAAGSITKAGLHACSKNPQAEACATRR